MISRWIKCTVFIFAQSAGDDQSARAATGDDVVVFCLQGPEIPLYAPGFLVETRCQSEEWHQKRKYFTESVASHDHN